LLPGLKYLDKVIDVAGNELKAQLTQMIANLEAITKDTTATAVASQAPGTDQPATNATQAFMNIFNYQTWQMPTWNLGAMGTNPTAPGAAPPAAAGAPRTTGPTTPAIPQPK